jgi:hypothetical protein
MIRAAITPRRRRSSSATRTTRPARSSTGPSSRRSPRSREHDLLVYSDEIYDRLVYGDHEHTAFSALPVDARAHVCSGLQQELRDDRLADRLGWPPGGADGRDREGPPVRDHVRPDARAVRRDRGAAQRRAPSQAMRAEYDRRRRYITDRFNEIGLPTFEPKGAFYCFPRVTDATGLDDSAFAERLLPRSASGSCPGPPSDPRAPATFGSATPPHTRRSSRRWIGSSASWDTIERDVRQHVGLLADGERLRRLRSRPPSSRWRWRSSAGPSCAPTRPSLDVGTGNRHGGAPRPRAGTAGHRSRRRGGDARDRPPRGPGGRAHRGRFHPDPACDDGSVDVLIAVHALLFASDRVAALAEWLRVTAPGGRISLSVPGPGNVAPSAVFGTRYSGTASSGTRTTIRTPPSWPRGLTAPDGRTSRRTPDPTTGISLADEDAFPGVAESRPHVHRIGPPSGSTPSRAT